MWNQFVRAWPSRAFRYFQGSTRGDIRTVLLVEQRSEVFARLASDLTAQGLIVERAVTAKEACLGFSNSAAELILVNRELSPDESGWLLLSKWALGGHNRRVWLYTAWPAAFDEQWSAFTKVEQLLYYGGNVWELSNRVLEQLGRGVAANRQTRVGVRAA